MLLGKVISFSVQRKSKGCLQDMETWRLANVVFYQSNTTTVISSVDWPRTIQGRLFGTLF